MLKLRVTSRAMNLQTIGKFDALSMAVLRVAVVLEITASSCLPVVERGGEPASGLIAVPGDNVFFLRRVRGC